MEPLPCPRGGVQPRIYDATPLRGGLTSEVFEATTDRWDHAVVCKRSPDHRDIAVEAANLRLAGAHLGDLVPQVLETGRDEESSWIWMTKLPGILGGSGDAGNKITAIASAVARVRVGLESASIANPPSWVGGFESWIEMTEPPPYSATPGAWRACLASAKDLSANCPRAVLVHRDLHPNNILVQEGEPTGVVDWLELCWGQPEVDISRARVQTWLLAGRTAANELLRLCETTSSRSYDVRWDGLVACELGDPADWLAQTYADAGAVISNSTLRERMDEIVMATARMIP